MKQLSEYEKKDQREKIVEEDDGAVAQRELDVDRGLRSVAPYHSRSLFPVSSMKTSSSVGRFRWMSASPMPSCSIHFTRSTMARAGCSQCTVSDFRSSEKTCFSVPRNAGNPSAGMG